MTSPEWLKARDECNSLMEIFSFVGDYHGAGQKALVKILMERNSSVQKLELAIASAAEWKLKAERLEWEVNALRDRLSRIA